MQTKFSFFFQTGSKFTSIGPIYYEYGSMLITFDNSDSAVQAYELLRVAIYEDKKLLGKLLLGSRPMGTLHKIIYGWGLEVLTSEGTVGGFESLNLYKIPYEMRTSSPQP